MNYRPNRMLPKTRQAVFSFYEQATQKGTKRAGESYRERSGDGHAQVSALPHSCLTYAADAPL